MQKYLLLLLMCLVGIIETQAGIKVDNVGTGSYVLTFTNGTVEDDWKALSSIKSATSVKIVTDGYQLSTSDMKSITGDKDTTPFFANLKTLDMEKAEMASYQDLKHIGYDKLKKLETFSFPEKTDIIPLLDNKGLFQGNNHIKTVLMYENPENNDLSSFKVIPEYTFQDASNLEIVRIPEGVTEIGRGAFAGGSAGKAPQIASIHFPNTLKRIEYNAFAYNSELTSVTIPPNVNYIGDNAFKENKKLEDVYVLGNHVETFDGSFNQEYTYDGFSFDNGNDGNNSVVSINDWKSSKPYVKHPARLHFPNNPEAYKYCVNPFLRALNALTSSELALLDNYQSNAELDKKLKSYGSFNGWHNFMFAAGDLEEKIWYEGRLVESRWYSAVFPFDMSYNQVMTTYGVKTDIREFSYVNKHIVDGQEVRTVTFSKKLPIPDDKNNAIYVQKGVPYMIHPGVRSVPVTTTTKSGSSTQTYRTIAGVDVKNANNTIATEDPEPVKGDLVDGDKPTRSGDNYQVIIKEAYIFKGTYKKKDIPANSFYLGYEPPKWPLAYYLTKVVQTGKWNPFTSIVQKVVSETSYQAKTMDLDFSELFGEDFGITTAVENAVVNESSKNNGVVYNLSGQAVRENNASLEGLSKGVYVVNGKKIVVR